MQEKCPRLSDYRFELDRVSFQMSLGQIKVIAQNKCQDTIRG